MIPIIIIVISILLDGLLTNILPYTVNNLSLFTPMFTILIPIIIYPFYIKQEKKYLITLIITGIVYDIFYTNLLFYNAIIFFVFGLIVIKLYKNIGYDFIKVLIYSLISIILYEIFNMIIILIFNLVPITPYRVIYKITHSIIINIIYVTILYFIVRILPKKYKKIRIN